MSNVETDSDLKEDNKRKIKYLKLDWRRADLEKLIERIDSRWNIKRTYRSIGGRHPSKRIHPDLIDNSVE